MTVDVRACLLRVCPSTWYVYPPPRGQRHSSCVRACAQTTATSAPDCNTTSSSSSSVASRRWSQVLAPQRVNPTLAVAVGKMFHRAAKHRRYHFVRKYNSIVVQLNDHYISEQIGRMSSTVFAFLMPCWYSYSYHNNRYIFGQGDMTCLRSSKRTLKPSNMKYPLEKHPNNLMPYKFIPRYGLGANNRHTWYDTKVLYTAVSYPTHDTPHILVL